MSIYDFKNLSILHFLHPILIINELNEFILHPSCTHLAPKSLKILLVLDVSCLIHRLVAIKIHYENLCLSFSTLLGFSGFFGIHLLIPKISKKSKIWSFIRAELSRLDFRLPATSELRPSGLTTAAWLNEKGSQPRRFRVIRAIRVRKHDVAVFCGRFAQNL